MIYAVKRAKIQTMRNSVVFLVAFALAFVAASCNVERSEKYQALLAERDSLYTEAVAARGGFDNALNTINEIEALNKSIRNVFISLRSRSVFNSSNILRYL